MKLTFAAKTFAARCFGANTLAGAESQKLHRVEDGQTFAAGAVAGKEFHAGAILGQNHHTGTIAGLCHG